MLPVLKDNIRKIQRVYSPVGYIIAISTGKLANQNIEHFYTRLVPKYKINYGSQAMSEHYNPATPQQVEKIKKALQPNSEGEIDEKDNLVAKLHNEMTFAHIIITPKQPYKNNIDNFLRLDPKI